MLQPRQGVWCQTFGFGQVIVGGGRPFVRWLDGRVAGDSVEAMSAAAYDGEVMRRNQVGFGMRVYESDTPLERWQASWVRDDDGFWILSSRRQELLDRSRTIARPCMDEIDVCVDFLAADAVLDEAAVIRCTVTRGPRMLGATMA